MIDALKYYIEETTCNDEKAIRLVEGLIKEYNVGRQKQYLFLEIAKQFGIVFGDKENSRLFFETNSKIKTFFISDSDEDNDEEIGKWLFNHLFAKQIPCSVLDAVYPFMDFEAFAYSKYTKDFTYYQLENGKVALVKTDEL